MNESRLHCSCYCVDFFFSLHNKLETKIYQPSECDESQYFLACLCQMIILNGRVNIVLQLEVFLIIY